MTALKNDMSQNNNGLPDTEKSFVCWNEFKNDFVNYNPDEWDSYIERWYVKKRKDLIKKMSM